MRQVYFPNADMAYNGLVIVLFHGTVLIVEVI